MKISRLKILLVACLFLSNCFAAKAQMCGAFDINISVKSMDLKNINNAAVQFLPITKDQTFGKQFVRDEKDPSKFSIRFMEGQSVTELHKLIVSASGYKTAANEIKFASCRGNKITVTLPELKSKQSPGWQFRNSILIDTEDASGEGLKGVKISVYNGKKLVETKDSKYYGIGFELSNGIYTFLLTKSGYEPEKIKVDLTKVEDVKIIGKLKPKSGRVNL